jgi:N-acyl-D-amino-acid deacylase
MFDIAIVGGTIVDGTGKPASRADIGIVEDTITYIGRGRRIAADHVIDATGLTICPGLIDPHSHSDWSLLANRDALSTIRQGVTSEVVGNCGVTHAPLSATSAETALAGLRSFGYSGVCEWRSFAEYLHVVHSGGTAQNLLWFVGHSALRDAAGIRGSRVDQTQARSLVHHLEEALEAGVVGMSTGLEYGSGRSSTREELRTLADTLGRRNAMYASHIRNRDENLDSAIDEFFDIVRSGDLRAQLSHLNVRHNTGARDHAWAGAVDRLVHEREAGIDVLADMTPYPHGIGMATGILPPWFIEEPPAAAAACLRDPSVRERLRDDCDRYWRFIHRGQWGRVTLSTSPGTPELEGLTFPEIAGRLGKDEWDCYFDILESAGSDMGGVQFIGSLFTDDHLAEAIGHPLFALGVDGFTSSIEGPLFMRTQHPLFFYGHTHYLSHHVMTKHTLTFEEAIRKMTSMVADHFGIARRGRLVEGYRADLAIFDTDALQQQPTLKTPSGYADAAPFVIVNGSLVIDNYVHTGARCGQQLTSDKNR